MTAELGFARSAQQAEGEERAGRREWRPTREQVFAVLTPVVLLVAWEAGSRAGVLDIRVFSTPTDVAQRIWELVKTGELVHDTLVTLRRLALGVIFGVLPGLALGLVMGLSRNVRAAINPIVSLLYPLPRVALFPLVLLIVGLNESSLIIMVALGPLLTMIISTVAGVLNVEPIYFKVARSFETPRRQMYTKVVMPAAMPVIFSGLRLSLGLAMISVVAAEFLVGDDGIGHLIWHSWSILSLEDSMAGLVVAGLMGFGLFLFIDLLERRLVPWQTSRGAV